MKTKNYLLLLAFVGLAIVSLSFISDNALADTHTWDGGGTTALASNRDNWNCTTNGTNDILPITGDAIVFNSEFSKKACTFDLSTSFASITMTGTTAGNYINQTVNVLSTGTWSNAQWIWQTGTKTLNVDDITLGAAGQLQQTGTAGDVTCTSYLQNGAGSVLTGRADATFTVRGNVTKTAGTQTDLYLTMTGIGTYLEFPGESITSLIISNPVTSNNGMYLNNFSNMNGVTFTMNGTPYVFRLYSGLTFENNGKFNGNANLEFGFYDINKILSLGNISNNIRIFLHTASIAGRMLTLTNISDFYTLNIESDHLSEKMTVNLNGNRLSASGLITASTRGIIMSSVPGASIFGAASTINGGVINWTNIAWNPLPPVIDALSITKISGNNGIDEMMHYLAKFQGSSNSTITWSLANASAWMHVYPNNGTIYGLTDVNSQGNNTYELIASNAVGTTTYHGYLWVADTYYGSEEMDTILILMIIFLMFCTIMNICGMLWKIPLLSLVSFAILFAGIFADPQIWDSLPMLPIGIVIINLIIMFLTIVRNRR